jgi:hypothetical protein
MAVGIGSDLFGKGPDFDDPSHLETIGERVRKFLNKVSSADPKEQGASANTGRGRQ